MQELQGTYFNSLIQSYQLASDLMEIESNYHFTIALQLIK